MSHKHKKFEWELRKLVQSYLEQDVDARALRTRMALVHHDLTETAKKQAETNKSPAVRP